MQDIFFTADLHLGHKNIIKYCNRPFATVDEMNEMLIKNWNKVVKKDSKVFLLGDFGLGTAEQIKKWGNALRGNKTLILGNHDRMSKSVYLEAGFNEVIRYPVVWADNYLLSHYPKRIEMGQLFNIYGHVHNHTDEHLPKNKGCCVSVEMTDYKPISFKQIVAKAK